MTTANSLHNCVVWCDIPVVDLDRATAFYAAVMNNAVKKESFGTWQFSVFQHAEGNGGCLVPNAKEVTATQGILVYLNVQGRIRDAVKKVEELGGAVLEPVHAIGPHGFRALIKDTEGNRIALHSQIDQ